jgi:hypothetical protein
MTGDVYIAGVEEHLRDGVKLRVYGVAKTVVDCFKHRNKIGLDVALEALKDARAKHKATADVVIACLTSCKPSEKVRTSIGARCRPAQLRWDCLAQMRIIRVKYPQFGWRQVLT